MFFEGSEKKLEIVVSSESGSLLEWPKEKWSQLVEAAQAQILSEISTPQCKAYLLSESSLFVWRDRITMITCGGTTLITAAELFVDWVKMDQIDCLIYERKNEYHPHLQCTNAFEDMNSLKKLGDFEGYRYGNADEHHLYLMSLLKPYEPTQGDTTLELLMYDLDPEIQRVLSHPNQKIDDVRELISVAEILPDFVVDDYLFEPYGYSLNALKDECYYTIHVTPQEEGSYVSFETNVPTKQSYLELINNVLQIFKPRTFDIVSFTESELPIDSFTGFLNLNTIHGELRSGYGVTYSHFVKPPRQSGSPAQLK